MSASGCESGNLPGLVEAGTLREKECGDGPRYSREAFFVARRDLLLARLAERACVAQAVNAESPERRQECLRHLSRVSLLGDRIGARRATPDFFLRGDFLRDAWRCCGARCGWRAKGCARDGVEAG